MAHLLVCWTPNREVLSLIPGICSCKGISLWKQFYPSLSQLPAQSLSVEVSNMKIQSWLTCVSIMWPAVLCIRSSRSFADVTLSYKVQLFNLVVIFIFSFFPSLVEVLILLFSPNLVVIHIEIIVLFRCTIYTCVATNF